MKCWSEKKLNVHHATYERLWNENIETDLFPLCLRCHEFFHKKYVWHIIANTLDFISTKELPKYEPAKKVYKKVVVKKVKPKWSKSKIEERKKKKDNKNKTKKEKAPYSSKVYSKTQGKKYKYNNFVL